MTRTPVLCLIALLLGPLAALPSPARAQSAERGRIVVRDSTFEERALVKLENDWAKAVIRRDAPGIRRLVDAQWVYTDENGIMTREEGITAFTTGTDTVQQAGNEQMRVVLHGNTVAVVTGILWMRGRGPNGAFVHRYRYTDTWMRKQGVWRCIASQDLLLPNP
jgi:ketosteroid isomerase-like protein